MDIMADMFAAHPTAPSAPETRLDLIAALAECGDVCAACADACVAADLVSELRHTIRHNSDCCDIVRATEAILSRRTAGDPIVIKSIVEAAQIACLHCAEECERNAGVYEFCRLCAESCRRCAEACDAYLA